MIGPAEFISDPNLLGPYFPSQPATNRRRRPVDTWRAWRIVLKGAFAELMTAAEVARFREIAGREPPTTRVRELWLALGRRAGKDSIASAIAVHAAATGDFARNLRPGEKATILCLATNREQAAIVFNYVKASFEQVPLLAPLVRCVDSDTVELNNGVEVTVATNSFRSIRGRTVALAILDELAFWRDESGAYQNPDTEVYRAILPSLTTLRNAGSMIIGISSVYRRSGLLYNKIRAHAGQPGDILAIIGRVEVWRGSGSPSISVFRPFRLAVPYRFGLGSVSTPRSSNRTCGSPASGSRTRPHAIAHDGPRPSRVRRTSPKNP
jgi:hypothetical protein